MNGVHEKHGGDEIPKIIDNPRDSILAKGKEMLLEGNYNDFNIRNLAKSCNIGLGTMYNYFANKEELAGSIFTSDWEKTLKMADELKGQAIPFKEKLHQVYSSLETFLGQYMSIFHEIADVTGKVCPHAHYVEIHLKMKELIEEERKTCSINPEIDSGKLAYFIMMSMFDVIKYRHLTFDELYQCIRI